MILAVCNQFRKLDSEDTGEPGPMKESRSCNYTRFKEQYLNTESPNLEGNLHISNGHGLTR